MSGSSQCFTFLSNLLVMYLQMYEVFFQHLSKLESNLTQCFERIYQAMKGFVILSSNLPHQPLWNKSKKTIL